MTYQEFESNHPDLVSSVNPATLRVWKKRGRVPDAAFQKLIGSVSKPDETVASVSNGDPYRNRDVCPHKGWVWDDAPTKGYWRVKYAQEWPTGPWHEIMEDGYCRGYPGDKGTMRMERTPLAIREANKDKPEKDIRKAIKKAGYPVMSMGTAIK